MPKCLALRIIRLHIPLNPNDEKWQSDRAENTHVEVDGPDVSSPDGQENFMARRALQLAVVTIHLESGLINLAGRI